MYVSADMVARGRGERKGMLVKKYQRVRVTNYLCKYNSSVSTRDTYLIDRRHGMTACLDCWAMGTKWKYCSTEKKKYSVLGRLEQLRAGQKSLALARWAQRSNKGRTPFIRTLWVSICLSLKLLLPAINCRRCRYYRGLTFPGIVVAGDKFVALSWNRWKSGTRLNHRCQRHRW